MGDCVRLRLLVITAITCIVITEVKVNGSGVVTAVNRRDAGDIYYVHELNDSVAQRQTCHDTNHPDNLTYLISERLCVKNQELLNERGCNLSIAPDDDSNLTLLTLAITDRRSLSLLRTAATVAVNSNPPRTNAVVVYSATRQVLVRRSCHISALEVYRGRNHVTRISHSGFSLSSNGTIEIDNVSLAYDFREYLGELYRMNLSCSVVGLPESGCLFFKVIGESNITNSKFGNRVQGTNVVVSDPIVTESATTTTSSGTSQSSHGPQKTVTMTMTMSMLDKNTSEEGQNLHVYIIAAATGIVVLSFVVVVLCIVFLYCCLTDRKRMQRQSTSAVGNSTGLWVEQNDLINNDINTARW